MRLLGFLISFFTLFSLLSQEDKVWLHPNRGQWDERILYKIDAVDGSMLVENKGFNFHFFNASEIYHKGHGHEGHNHAESLKEHSIEMFFVGANLTAKLQEKDSSTHYRNYFLGNDKSKWKSAIKSISQLTYESFYPGIDFKLEGKSKLLEYSFLVKPNYSPEVIQFQLNGASKVYLDKLGNLHVVHSFGEIVQSAPKAWNISESGKRKEVNIKFELKGNKVQFAFPDGYNSQERLLIDPELTFSTFTGATSDNWGFTAAPDKDGKVFAAGIVFGSGYPTSAGAFDVTYNGSGSNPGFDVSIMKFNDIGTNLIYSTFIGGTGSETPNSIICNDANELFIMGITSSANFPMGGASQYDNSYNGGPSESQNNLNFPTGTDLYVAKLNATGTVLLGSTFIGGTGTDGLNIGALQFNYGDQFRGEIIIDPQGNPIVASTTRSVNFPTVNGFQNTLDGNQDAVVFKLNSSLSTLIFSTYFGGSGLESGNSIAIASSGELFMTGGITSNGLTFQGGHMPTHQGGTTDGYLLRLGSSNNPSVLSATYIGSNEYDQSYFVQTDLDDHVYVLGQSEANLPISPGLYGTPNSGQFVRKYTSDLSTLEWNTTIGAGTGHVEISPTAFLVSDCYEIYISGWGGVLNQNTSYSQAVNSTTFGFQTTSDAFQQNTNGSNFYIAVLSQDAATLKYATYMGGVNSSNNHVEGGTSRFDKSGRMYHAVCGACGGNDFGFTTTPGVFSPSNPSANCNLAVFKFELNQIEAIIGEPEPLICLPDPVNFINNSANGNTFTWNFGDGNGSMEENPTHEYANPGTYTVSLIVSDSTGCFSPDTVYFEINLGAFNGNVQSIVSPICPGTPFELNASGGATYQWSPANVLSNPNIANPIATVFETTVFTVIVSDSCGIDTLEVTLPVYSGAPAASNDTSICIGNTVHLFATGGGTYSWSPSESLSNPNISNPVATPQETTTYTVDIVSPEGCEFSESVLIEVFFNPPVPIIPDTIFLCRGLSTSISVSGASSYIWLPSPHISPVVGPNVTLNPPVDEWFYCDFLNACGAIRDSVFVSVVDANITAGNDTTICPGQIANLYAFGGVSYQWFPSTGLLNNDNDTVRVKPSVPSTYTVIGVDANGCVDSASVSVSLYTAAFIQTVPDVYAFIGDVITLGATTATPGPIFWSPSEYLSCVVCNNPTANPDQNYTYTATYQDANGCRASDKVTIFYDAIIFVPNTFTPNQSLINEVFQAIGGNVKTFKMTIYNRWGEVIKEMTSLDEFWDGTYKGLPCQDGTYVWKLVYTDFSDNEMKRVGHINLLR